MRIAYLISSYPEFHETFVAREVEALRGKKTPLRIFSLKSPSEAERSLYPAHLEHIEYSSFLLSAPVLAANLAEAVRAPHRYLRALLWLCRSHVTQPKEMAKAVAAFPKTVYYARLMRGNFDVVHAHWATIPAAMAVVVNKLTGVNFSITAHAWDIFLSPTRLLKKKIELSRGVVTCTGYNRDYLKSICRPEDRWKIHLNYHGLDLTKFPAPGKPQPSGPFRLVAVGRLVEQKGFTHLIRAMALLGSKKVPAHLSLIGEGPLYGTLLAEASQVPHPAVIEFCGRVGHAETLQRMSQSHVMVAPSVIAGNGDRDGIPNVILEAMACSVPVIASAVSGIPEVVSDGKTGLLVPPGDPEVLAEALKDLAADPEAAALLGASGRRFIERTFDVIRNTDDFIDLLKKFHVEWENPEAAARGVELADLDAKVAAYKAES